MPSTGKCPEWVDQIPDARLEEFKLLVSEVQQHVLKSASGAVITGEDPRTWHQTLFAAFAPLPYYAGNYRGEDPSRRCLAVDVRVGSIVGTSFREVRRSIKSHFRLVGDQLNELEQRWARITPDDRAIQLAVITANLVGGFIRIHPFVNGNGRTSRLLWRWSMLRFGVPPQFTTHPRPNPPYSDLMKAAMLGDNRPLVLFVLNHLNLHTPARP